MLLCCFFSSMTLQIDQTIEEVGEAAKKNQKFPSFYVTLHSKKFMKEPKEIEEEVNSKIRTSTFRI